ncbi:Conserved_hypothetical protein [Hexamita inflata]|uniref:FERM central domain-containing protein n=1 Tax=Hexamita inflata TaxID=28002 RepID=A0AA86NYG5_9EUKA|nr:Conserved hypothetical protein [Hexamita inflata]
MHLKIYYIGSCTGVKITEQTTVKEVVEFVLSKNQVPTEYASMCSIIAKNGKEFGSILSHYEQIIKYQNHALCFRILRFFEREQIEQIDPHFLQMAQLQMHRFIIDNLWLTDQMTACNLAAYQCGIEFGQYTNQVYSFLNNTISSLISPIFIDEPKRIQKTIIRKWKEFTETEQIQNIEQAVLNYVLTVAEWIPQFGTYVIGCQLLNQDFLVGSDCFLSVGGNKCLVQSLQNQQLLVYSDWASLDLKIINGSFKKFNILTNNQKFEFQCDDLLQFQKIIEWQRSCSYDSILCAQQTEISTKIDENQVLIE